ncbi:MAG: hypothetical protein K6A89_11665 [Treponema sp.]|nr:hypothetical protein [Treponema sp.]
MKRIFCILLLLSFCIPAMFAASDEDIYDDYEYEQNGAGDQFFKVDLTAAIPLNFTGSTANADINTQGKWQMKVGPAFGLSYFRFIGTTLALGGDIGFAYNATLKRRALLTVPITLGILYQPYVGNFEFPLTLTLGISALSCQGMTFFPAFTAKGSAGIFYRINESWSTGFNASLMYIPMWLKDEYKGLYKNPDGSDKTYDYGLFTNAGIAVRYHF